eukprot:3846809-Pleurochrysis_carterae.AAC.1
MAWARRKVGMVAASSAVEGEGTLLNKVRAARNLSAVKWMLAEALRRACGEEVSPRTPRKSARSASGRASPVWNDRGLAEWMNFRCSGTGNKLEARSGAVGEGAVVVSGGTSTQASSVDCECCGDWPKAGRR